MNVLEKKQTVLGSEWVVYKRDVELLFKNEKYAAITGVNQDEEVVTKTSRMLENGMRVKRKDVMKNKSVVKRKILDSSKSDYFY